jgi:probable HAF family extracellular repeat protein
VILAKSFARACERIFIVFYAPILIIIGVVLSGAIPSGVAWAVGEYEVTDLGTISTYGSKAYCINDSGLVVGRVSDDFTTVNGVAWSAGAGIQQLSSLGGQTKAWGINYSGEIAGQSNNHAVLWSNASASPTDLGTPGLGGTTSFAYGISNAGQVVGWADRETYQDYQDTIYHAFVYSNGTMYDLGTLATDRGYYLGGYSLAYGANSSGHVVGTASTTGWYYHAFKWDSTNHMIDLGTNPNHADHEGYAVAINESGSVIAGCSKVTGTPESYPMLWLDGSTTPVLVSTLAGFPYAEFYSVNGSEQVVGLMWNVSDTTQHAFIYETGKGIQDLNDMLPASSGWELTFAKSINEYGQIVGGGKHGGEDRAFLLTPKIYFISSVMSGSGPLYVCFTNTSTTTPTSWLWDFGDGTASTEKNPCHMYKTAGSYTVTLTGDTLTSTRNALIDVASCANNPVKIVRTSAYFTSIQSAFASASQANDVVQAQALDRTEDLIWNNNRSVTLSGGFLCNYSSHPGFTTVHSLTIASGTLTVENMIIQ